MNIWTCIILATWALNFVSLLFKTGETAEITPRSNAITFGYYLFLAFCLFKAVQAGG